MFMHIGNIVIFKSMNKAFQFVTPFVLIPYCFSQMYFVITA